MNDAERTQAAQHAGRVLEFLGGDVEAARFVDGLFFISQVWDDLVDRDREVDPEDVSRAFWLAMAELPANGFYARHRQELLPLVRMAMSDWLDATALERGTAHERTVAFTLRDNLAAVVTGCAYLKGGYEWMRKVSPEIRRMIHDETLGTYLRGLK